MTDHFQTSFKFGLVIVAGIAVFLLDYFGLANPLVNEWVLFFISLAKSSYFIWFVFDTIRRTAGREFYFHHFLGFMCLNILLFLLSFAIDFYCLQKIDPDAFRQSFTELSLVGEFVAFLYFSISTFTTAGLGDILPNSTASQVLVGMELLTGFFFTVLLLANISHIRSLPLGKDGDQ